jgi:hypothetical protein
MKKIIFTVILLAGCLGYTFAQTEGNTGKKEKATDMYIGVQINGLIRQIFNFNNSNANTNTNPYLLVYSFNSRKTGWGLRFGAGYNYNAFTTDDGITKTENNINDMQFRIGGERSFMLSRKWSAGAGVDIVFNRNDDHTVSVVNSTPFGGGETVDTRTQSNTYGGGPQAWLRYHITDRVIIGTETSFYYITGHETKAITVDNGFPSPSQPNQDNSVSHGTFNSPIAFFLMVKF